MPPLFQGVSGPDKNFTEMGIPYNRLEQQLQTITRTCNTVAAQMIALLNRAEFGQSGHSSAQTQVSSETQDQSLLARGNDLLKQVRSIK